MSRILILVVTLLTRVYLTHAEQPTREQLDSLSSKALQMQRLIDQVKTYAYSTPAEVSSFIGLDLRDPGASLFGNVISHAFAHAAQDDRASTVIWSVISGVFNQWSTLPPSSIGSPNSHEDRFDKSMVEMSRLFMRVHDSAAVYWNTSYRLPFTIAIGGVPRDSISIGELWNVGVPQFGTKENLEFQQLARTAWRREITKRQVQKNYRIAYPYRVTSMSAGLAWGKSLARNPEADTNADNSPQTWDLMGTDGAIVSKLDLPYGGVSDNRWDKPGADVGHLELGPNTIESFFAALKKFHEDYEPGCYVHLAPAPPAPEYLSFRIFFLVPQNLGTGVAGKDGDEYTRWTQLGDPTSWVIDRRKIVEISKWLFIDDGYGNVLNRDGVVNRRELYFDWKLPGYKGITKSLSVSVDEERRRAVSCVSTQPNPASSYALVKLNLPYGQADVAMYDATGRRTLEVFRGLYAGGNTEIPVNIESLASGSYTLLAICETGGHVCMVVVQ